MYSYVFIHLSCLDFIEVLIRNDSVNCLSWFDSRCRWAECHTIWHLWTCCPLHDRKAPFQRWALIWTNVFCRWRTMRVDCKQFEDDISEVLTSLTERRQKDNTWMLQCTKSHYYNFLNPFNSKMLSQKYLQPWLIHLLDFFFCVLLLFLCSSVASTFSTMPAFCIHYSLHLCFDSFKISGYLWYHVHTLSFVRIIKLILKIETSK